MFRRYRIGNLFGFPIEVNPTFLLMLAMSLLFWGVRGLIVMLVAFASVVLHELGHALMARYLGVPVAGIELHFFGGAAKMVGLPKTANDEIVIAAAGPAVSFALGGVGLMLGGVTGVGFFDSIGWINVVIGIFNLLPALPMDGGRILRALLTRKHEFVRATEISIRIARVLAIVLAVYGLLSWQIYLPLLAAMLWLMGSRELQAARYMSSWFTYDKNGYRQRGDGDVEVMPHDYWAATGPGSQPFAQASSGFVQPFGFGWTRTAPGQYSGRLGSLGGFVIRRRNGRLTIEFVD